MSRKNTPITLVDNQFELREATRMARMDLYDRKIQGIFTDIETIMTPRNQQLVTLSKRMERVNTKNEKYDELLCRAVKREDAAAMFDMGVRGKIEDVVFPYKGEIKYYGPLTDVGDKDMKFFVTHEAAESMSDSGVDFRLFDEELDEIQSINATDEQSDLAEVTYGHRQEIASIRRQMAVCRAKIHARKPEWAGLTNAEFVQTLIKKGEGEDSRQYLILETRLLKNKKYIDTYSSGIMALTMPKVFVPEHISQDDIKLPCFDIQSERFMAEKLSLFDINELANQNVDEIETVQLEEIPDLVIEL